jgi:hypothetical protein
MAAWLCCLLYRLCSTDPPISLVFYLITKPIDSEVLPLLWLLSREIGANERQSGRQTSGQDSAGCWAGPWMHSSKYICAKNMGGPCPSLTLTELRPWMRDKAKIGDHFSAWPKSYHKLSKQNVAQRVDGPEQPPRVWL